MSFSLGNKNKVYQSKIEDFKFNSFDKKSSQHESFSLPELDPKKDLTKIVSKEAIAISSKVEQETGFHLASLVRKHRGIIDYKKNEDEKKINEKVDIRVKKLYDQSYQQGLDLGKEEGAQAAYEEQLTSLEEEVNKMAGIIQNFQLSLNDVYEKNKREAYSLIKNLTKWIVLKEVNDDKDYLYRLLEKLVNEITTKTNLVIRVNENDFKAMPEFIEMLEKKVGELTNVRVEVDLEMQDKGLILETSNALINGSLPEQFKAIDALFEGVIGVEK